MARTSAEERKPLEVYKHLYQGPHSLSFAKSQLVPIPPLCIQAQVVPRPAPQPHIAEAAAVGPAYGVQANANHVVVVRQSGVVVVGKQTELLGLALAVMENDGALPTALLVVVGLPR
jgi:hypothetical protein